MRRFHSEKRRPCGSWWELRRQPASAGAAEASDPGLVSGPPGEPPEERFERAQGRRDRRRAQLLAGPGVRLLGKTGFERLGLLDVEIVEIAESGAAFEAM